jgi:hypothetical protein
VLRAAEEERRECEEEEEAGAERRRGREREAGNNPGSGAASGLLGAQQVAEGLTPTSESPSFLNSHDSDAAGYDPIEAASRMASRAISPRYLPEIIFSKTYKTWRGTVRRPVR